MTMTPQLVGYFALGAALASSYSGVTSPQWAINVTNIQQPRKQSDCFADKSARPVLCKEYIIGIEGGSLHAAVVFAIPKPPSLLIS